MNTAVFVTDRSTRRIKNMGNASIVFWIVFVFSVFLNVFLLVANWTQRDTCGRSNKTQTLPRNVVSLDYIGTSTNSPMVLIDHFVLSNHWSHSVFTYKTENDFQQSTYVSRSGQIAHSEDFFFVSGSDLSAALVEIPPDRVRLLSIKRCNIDFPWKYRSDILFADSYDSTVLFHVESPFVYSNNWITPDN